MHQVDLKNKNLLLVLGNGYDLAAGCKTSYVDYYDYLKTKDDYKTLFGYCNYYFDTKDQIGYIQLTSFMEDHKDIPIWTIYFYYTSLINSDFSNEGRWFDIENELRNFLTTKLDILTNYINREQIDKDSDDYLIIDLIARLIDNRYFLYSRSNDKYVDKKPTKDVISDILLDDLNAFEKDLASYLIKYDIIIGGPGNERIRLLQWMRNVFTSIDALKICSFNYTHIPEGNDVYYPHGSCENPIIGIDLVDEGEIEITKFSKSRRKSLDHSLTTYGDYLGNSKYTVAFFGLSFSFTDLNDFKIITDYLNSDFEICILYKPYKKGEDMYDPKDELIDSFKELSKNIDNLHIKNDSDFYEFKETNKIRFIDITQIESE